MEEFNIEKLLGRYLQFQSTTGGSQSHLDEDSLNSFVEGRLSQTEASGVLKHLIHCSFCLHITAELTKLEYDFAEQPTPEVVTTGKPEKISEVLSGILSKIFGTSDGAVFAHQENKEDEPKKED